MYNLKEYYLSSEQLAKYLDWEILIKRHKNRRTCLQLRRNRRSKIPIMIFRSSFFIDGVYCHIKQ